MENHDRPRDHSPERMFHLEIRSFHEFVLFCRLIRSGLDDTELNDRLLAATAQARASNDATEAATEAAHNTATARANPPVASQA